MRYNINMDEELHTEIAEEAARQKMSFSRAITEGMQWWVKLSKYKTAGVWVTVMDDGEERKVLLP